jgi:hypothetical protein
MEIRMCEGPGCQRELPAAGRADQRYCSRACRLRAFRKRRLKKKLRSYYTETAKSLAELHQRASRPDHWADIEAGPADDELLEHTDYFDVGIYEDERQEDETGIVAGDTAPDPWAERNTAWAERQAHADAVEQIRARYAGLLQPYEQSMRRNIGVKPVVVARLEAQRDAEIQGLTRKHHLAQAYELADRNAPQRAVQAAERQFEQAALNAFGRDLPGGSRRYQPPEWTGRPTDDIAVW